MKSEKIRKSIIGWILTSFLIMAVFLPVHADVDDNNVVIVLDASGSMGDAMHQSSMLKIDAAKAALREVLREVPMDTNIGLLVFSAGNISDDWVYPLGPRDDMALIEAIDRPVPYGGTPLGDYIKKGADRLLEKRDEQFGYGTYRLLIVTDGEAGDPDLVELYVPEVTARGITIDVIGVDMRTTHTLATKVHSYRRADDPATLKKALAAVFAEVGGTDSDAASEDAFAQIAPIPDEMASVMLKALSASGNQPIGERAVDDEDSGDSAIPTQVEDEGGCADVFFAFIFVFFVVFGVIIFIIILVVKSRK